MSRLSLSPITICLHLLQLLQLQVRVKQGMQQDDWLYPCEEEELRFILAGGGYALGLFEEDKLLGAWPPSPF